MYTWFKDLPDLESFPWLTEPFAGNILDNKCDSAKQELLIKLHSNKEASAIFNAHG